MSFGLWPWLTLVLLGAWHGLNPAMGWLFAVALGLQQRSRAAVFRALIPIAVGHALAIGLVVFVLFVLGTAVPVGWLQLGGGAILLGLGGWRLWRTRHPIWVGMRVGFWDLTSWSWIMASAHGAGVMLIPLLLRSNLRRDVEWQKSIIVFQLAVRRRRCPRSYHLASRRGWNHRLAGL